MASDSRGETLPLNVWRKGTILLVFLVAPPQGSETEEEGERKCDWSKNTVKCQAVIKQQTCFLFKKIRAGGKDLSFERAGGSQSS